MSLALGIVGLPNVGKSTLFNALTKNSVPAENYPFCTIDPNVGRVYVKDSRLDKLTELEKSKKTIYADVDFIDIAGIVKGASEGQGLGNKFLSEIAEADAIVHVVRIFENKDVIHVSNTVDPKSDIETINTELILKDLEVLKKVVNNFEKNSRFDVKAKLTADFLAELLKHLEESKLAKDFLKDKQEYIKANESLKADLSQISLITAKPTIYVANIDENSITNVNIENLKKVMGLTESDTVIPLSVKLESELSTLNEEDQKEFLSQYGLTESGIVILTHVAYDTLGLMSFFTTGEDESRAWTVRKGANAKEAAGKIHTDFSDKFIAAEVVSYEDFVACGGYKGAAEKGKIRLESRDYVVKEADIMNFKHGA
jgi:GTP-binding protein YchF